jgi:hypothetical protein
LPVAGRSTENQDLGVLRNTREAQKQVNALAKSPALPGESLLFRN